MDESHLGVNAAWRGLTFGNGVFAAVADAGTNRAMTSSDGGVTWVARTAAAANEWNAVAYGAGFFVAVADTGTSRVMTSADGGVTWVAPDGGGGQRVERGRVWDEPLGGRREHGHRQSGDDQSGWDHVDGADLGGGCAVERGRLRR